MDLRDIKIEALKKAFLIAAVVGTILNLINNGEYLSMLFEPTPFSWKSFGKIFATYMIPFLVALYSQRFFMSIHLALLNVKTAFYMVDRKGKVVFISNKLLDEVNKNIGEQSKRQFNSCDIIGTSVQNLRSKFGFDENETEEFLRRFRDCDEVDGHRQVIGKLVNGKRYGLIASPNTALVKDSRFPAQGMFIPKDDLSRTEFGAVMMLAKAAESKDKNTGGHILRMRQYCRALGQKLALSEDDLELLDFGSILHDVGKIGIADKILNKPGKLVPDEWEIMKTHAVKGGNILRNGNDPFFMKVAVTTDQHHENHDGNGYPNGLKGEEIDPLARIIAVADTFDALTSERPYKERFSDEEVFKEMQAQRGKKLDPAVLDAFLECIKAEANPDLKTSLP